MSGLVRCFLPRHLASALRTFASGLVVTVALSATASAQPRIFVVAASDLHAAPNGKVTYSPGPNQSILLTQGTNVFTSFEAAVAAVNASTATTTNLFIAAGTFDIGVPQVTIAKAVTITGLGPGTTILRPGVSTPSATGDGRAMILINRGVEVHMSQLTIDGRAPAAIGTAPAIEIRDAVRITETGGAMPALGTFSHMDFRNIRAGDPGANQFDGVGVQARGGNANIVYCTFENMGFAGASFSDADALDGRTSSGQFSANVYTGKGAGNTLDYGVRVTNGSIVSIDSNSFTNALGERSSDGLDSAGVFASQDTTLGEQPSIVSLFANTFANDREGLIVGIPGQSADNTLITVTTNNFVGPFGDTFAIVSAQGHPMFAGTNYWNGPNGPQNSGNPGGDPAIRVTDNVIVTPIGLGAYPPNVVSDLSGMPSVSGSISGHITRQVYGTPVAGVTLFLDLNSNNTLDETEISATSDAAGAYAFTNLALPAFPSLLTMYVAPPDPLRAQIPWLIENLTIASPTKTENIELLGGYTLTAGFAGPNPAQVGEAVIIGATVLPTAATGTVTFTLDGVLAATVPLVNGTATLTRSDLSVGAHALLAVYNGSPLYDLSGTPGTGLIVLDGGVEHFTQYFAEGATGNFFHTHLGILNASQSDFAHLKVTMFPEAAGAQPTVTLMTLGPLSRRTIDLNDLLGNVSGVSTLVESDRPVAATRAMTWGSPVYGSTLESGAAGPSTSWYFAEGATNGFSLFYLVENPNSVPANITFTHLPEGGAAPVVTTDTVPAQSRKTFFINDVPGLQFAALSTVVTADQPIVAERAMYLNTTNRLWEGGSAGHGATTLNSSWYFAEGATGFFHTYLLFGNPGSNLATVTVVYQLPAGTTITKTYDVAGQSRRTIDIGGEDPQLAATSVGMSVASTQPIVAERAMWWGDPWTDGSASLGSTDTGTVWAIGGGTEGGANVASTFVLISNASATAGTVRLTIVYDDETRQQKDYPIAGHARLTVHVGDEFQQARKATFSVLVESLSATMPITVETAQYQSAAGTLDAGGAALATRIR